MGSKRKSKREKAIPKTPAEVARSSRRVATSGAAIAPVKFIESMECLAVAELPTGGGWVHEVKLDGFRMEPVKNGGETILYSRRGNVMNPKFPLVAAALQQLPDGTILDGEVVALDENGRSDFGLLQNFRSAAARIHFYGFDILALRGESLIGLPLSARRRILEDVLPQNEQIALAVVDPRPVKNLLSFAKSHGLEGVVSKNLESRYEPGRRSGMWCKHRINEGQEFVIGGYTPGSNGFDALIVGVYKGKDLHFVARVRNGFVPATRRQVYKSINDKRVSKCPFVNLPDKEAGQWGQGLTAEKMKDCVWLTPTNVVRLDFLEWTAGDRLRHPKFVALRDDKDPLKVTKEGRR